MPADASALLSVREAAQRLGIHESGVCRLIRAGRLPAQRLGERAYVIRAEDLALVATRVRTGRPPARRQPA